MKEEDEDEKLKKVQTSVPLKEVAGKKAEAPHHSSHHPTKKESDGKHNKDLKDYDEDFGISSAGNSQSSVVSKSKRKDSDEDEEDNESEKDPEKLQMEIDAEYANARKIIMATKVLRITQIIYRQKAKTVGFISMLGLVFSAYFIAGYFFSVKPF